MGAESGSQAVLDAMDKGTRVWQISEARENLRRHGIRACFFLQFGYPGETWDDIEKTIALVRDTAARRYRRLRLLSAARHAVLPASSPPSSAERELAGQRRSRHDVPGRVSPPSSTARWPTRCTLEVRTAGRSRPKRGPEYSR